MRFGIFTHLFGMKQVYDVECRAHLDGDITFHRCPAFRQFSVADILGVCKQIYADVSSWLEVNRKVRLYFLDVLLAPKAGRRSELKSIPFP